MNWSDKTSHRQKNYDVMDTDGRETFTVYVRQNLRITDDFSVGLLWHSPDGEKLTLVRYNGPSHPHRNHLENATLEFSCHIHRATRRYIDAGKKADGYATPTTAYSTVEGALDELIRDCNNPVYRHNPINRGYCDVHNNRTISKHPMQTPVHRRSRCAKGGSAHGADPIFLSRW